MKIFSLLLCPLVAAEVAWAFRLRPTPPAPPPKNLRLVVPHPPRPREGATVAASSIDSSLFSQAAAHSDRSLDDAERALEQAGKVLASTAAGRIRLPSPPNAPPPNFVPTPPRTPPTRAQARRAFEEAVKAFRQQSTDVRGRINGLTKKTRPSRAVETVDLFGEGDGAVVNGAGRQTRRRTRLTPAPPSSSNAAASRSSSADGSREAFAAAVGGAALGAVAGVALDVALGQDLLVDFDAYVTTSATLGVALAAASAYAATYPADLDDDDDATSSVARRTLAKGSRALGRAILGVVRSGVGRIGTAIESRVEDTVDEVRRTPDKIRAAATDASVRAVERIRDTPRMFAEGTRSVLRSGVDRIRGIPGQIGRAIEEKVEETVVEMRRTPEKIRAAATDASSVAVKKLQSTPVELAGSVSKIIPEATKSPQPPTVPPPVASKRDVKRSDATSAASTVIKPSPPKTKAPTPQAKAPPPPQTKAVKSPFFLSRRTREEEATIEARKLAERRKEEAARAVSGAEPGATISLFGFLFPNKQQTTTSSPPVPSSRPTTTARGGGSPRGVPTISNWRRNGAGAIVGFVSDSTRFEDGESITTSRIKGEAIGGTVVETVSGSRYFLEPPATVKGTIPSLKNQKKTGKMISAELKR